MSKHEVLIYEATILPHPNADLIELCQIGDYLSIVKKGEVISGDLVAYIPEQSIVPSDLLKYLGLEGRLSGGNKNRVKAVRLRGILSQGLIYKPQQPFSSDMLGRDIAEELGVVKWDPPIPAHLRGKAKGVALPLTVNYDIENIKKWNRHFVDGEEVVVMEKIHGTNVQIGYSPDYMPELKEVLVDGNWWVTSKGLGGRGIVLDTEDTENLYVKIATSSEYGFMEKLKRLFEQERERFEELAGVKNPPVVFMGEIFGPGVQSGFPYGTKVQFRLFDIAVGPRSSRVYVDWNELQRFSEMLSLPLAPVLYVGPYSKEIVLQHTSGRETISGAAMHIREGCVVRPVKERDSGNLGRVILKSVSPEYLTRAGSEEELTEFQ